MSHAIFEHDDCGKMNESNVFVRMKIIGVHICFSEKIRDVSVVFGMFTKLQLRWKVQQW